MRKVARQVFIGILLLAMCFSSMSCYTVLKRPGVRPEEDRYLERGYYSEGWVYPRYLWYDPFYGWYYPGAYSRWRYYYAYPWWWDNYWYWHPSNGEGVPPVDTDRHIWDRRRGPDWSRPPSTPSPPSDASQPRERPQRPPEKSQPTDSPKDQQRRRPDWKRQPSHSAPSEQKSKDRGQQEEAKESGEEQ